MNKIDHRLVRSLNELEMSIEFGGKALGLAKLVNNGFSIPNGFAISSQAMFLLDEFGILSDQFLKRIGSNNAQHESTSGKDMLPPESLWREIEKCYSNTINPSVDALAVRSSAPFEDGEKFSFAGIYDTIFCDPTDVRKSIGKVWESLFSDVAAAYLSHFKIAPKSKEFGMGVVIQEKIQADISGVLFTKDPLSDENYMRMNLSMGLGDALVSGKIQPWECRISRDSLTISDIISPMGEQHANEQILPILQQQVQELINTSFAVEQIFNAPVDVEWCIASNKIYLLQARPITTTYT